MRAMIGGIMVAGVAVAFADGTGGRAKATLKNAQGQAVGDATLTDTPSGVLIHLNLTNAPAGVRAIHIHETGKCEAPFTSAGGHFNPTKKEHGLDNANGMHAGDMPNITVPSSGVLAFDILDHAVTLRAGSTSLLDADGSAIVIHDKADDYRSDPAGNAGDRVICGVVTK